MKNKGANTLPEPRNLQAAEFSREPRSAGSHYHVAPQHPGDIASSSSARRRPCFSHPSCLQSSLTTHQGSRMSSQEVTRIWSTHRYYLSTTECYTIQLRMASRLVIYLICPKYFFQTIKWGMGVGGNEQEYNASNHSE